MILAVDDEVVAVAGDDSAKDAIVEAVIVSKVEAEEVDESVLLPRRCLRNQVFLLVAEDVSSLALVDIANCGPSTTLPFACSVAPECAFPNTERKGLKLGIVIFESRLARTVKFGSWPPPVGSEGPSCTGKLMR